MAAIQINTTKNIFFHLLELKRQFKKKVESSIYHRK